MRGRNPMKSVAPTEATKKEILEPSEQGAGDAWTTVRSIARARQVRFLTAAHAPSVCLDLG